MKTCKYCNEQKPISEFRKHKEKDYIYPYCKGCGVYMAKRSMYGGTIQQIMKLKKKENCAICNIYIEEEKHRMIDHDHSGPFIRDILCSRCNTSLGVIETLQVPLNEYLKYIRKHKKVNERIKID